MRTDGSECNAAGARSPSARRMPFRALCFASAIVTTALGGSLFGRLAAAPPPEVEMAGYATTLVGRSQSQRHNARLSAEQINGRIVPPGGVFSFVKSVNSWSVDRGYVKAPVSFDGELLRAFGGGVCQTSTTLYNAALLSGMEIVERHSHEFTAHYVPPGQDAAVAFPSLDLRFRNPYPWPVRISATVKNEKLEVRLFGAAKPDLQYRVVAETLQRTPPTRITGRGAGPESYIRSPGAVGCRVVAFRLGLKNGVAVRHDRLSDDTYRAMDRIVVVGD
jgi:vancomycin resistance protein VanW